MDWFNNLMQFGALQGVFLIIGLFTIKSPRKKFVNLIYAFLVLLSVCFLVVNSIPHVRFIHPKAFLLSLLFIFYFTSVYHLFLEALSNNTFRYKKKYLVNLLPGIFYLLVISPFLFSSNEIIIELFKSQRVRVIIWSELAGMLLNIYFIYSCWIILKKNNFRWDRNQIFVLRMFTLIVLISNILWAILALKGLGILKFELGFAGFKVLLVNISFLLLFFTYFVVIKSEFFNQLQPRKTYINSGLTENEICVLKLKITECLRVEKPFKNPDFSLSDLSKLSNIGKFKLSIAINQGLKTTFFDLINSYRVDEFTALMSSKKYNNFSMLGVAYEAGFKSKSTFYKFFKKVKGTSPKDFFLISKS